MLKRFLPAAAVLAVLTIAAPAPAQELPEVRVIVFPGGNNWPIWAAQERGEFAKNGQLRKTLTDPKKYYDPSYYKKALGN
jgi:ABC-type nitrate/sulfonate/bicarbonate transport system substrate-binding protein